MQLTSSITFLNISVVRHTTLLAKACDSSWDPDDLFSAFPSPTPPISLVSHWLFPPNEHPPQHPTSIISLCSHCLTVNNPDPVLKDKPGDGDEADFKEWLEEFCEQLRVDRKKFFDELRKDLNLLKSS